MSKLNFWHFFVFLFIYNSIMTFVIINKKKYTIKKNENENESFINFSKNKIGKISNKDKEVLNNHLALTKQNKANKSIIQPIVKIA